MSENSERTRHVERVGIERNRRHVGLGHVQATRSSSFEHAGGEIDPARTPRHASHALEEQSGAATALEHVAPAAVALDDLDFEVVDERVVTMGLGLRSAS
jgi:hypothetical protein